MSLASLPPEVLLLIFECGILNNSDLKNIRSVNRLLGLTAEQPLFSKIFIRFASHKQRNSDGQEHLETVTQKIRSFVDDKELKHIPRNLDLLVISTHRDSGNGLTTFIKQTGRIFLKHFHKIERFKLDITSWHHKDQRAWTKLPKLLDMIIEFEQEGLQIGSFELCADWKWLQQFRQFPSSLKTLCILTSEKRHSKYTIRSIIDECNNVIGNAITNIPGLDSLDISKCIPGVSLSGICSLIDLDPKKSIQLKSLKLCNTQLVANQSSVSMIQLMRGLKEVDVVNIDKFGRKNLDHGPYQASSTIFTDFFTLRGHKPKKVIFSTLSTARLSYLALLEGALESLEIKCLNYSDGYVNYFFPEETLHNDRGTFLEGISTKFQEETIPAVASSLKYFSTCMWISSNPIVAAQKTSITFNSHLILSSASVAKLVEATKVDLCFSMFMQIISDCVNLSNANIDAMYIPRAGGRGIRAFDFDGAEKVILAWNHLSDRTSGASMDWIEGMRLSVTWNGVRKTRKNVFIQYRSVFVLQHKENIWRFALVQKAYPL